MIAVLLLCLLTEISLLIKPGQALAVSEIEFLANSDGENAVVQYAFNEELLANRNGLVLRLNLDDQTQVELKEEEITAASTLSFKLPTSAPRIGRFYLALVRKLLSGREEIHAEQEIAFDCSWGTKSEPQPCVASRHAAAPVELYLTLALQPSGGVEFTIMFPNEILHFNDSIFSFHSRNLGLISSSPFTSLSKAINDFGVYETKVLTPPLASMDEFFAVVFDKPSGRILAFSFAATDLHQQKKRRAPTFEEVNKASCEIRTFPYIASDGPSLDDKEAFERGTLRVMTPSNGMQYPTEFFGEGIAQMLFRMEATDLPCSKMKFRILINDVMVQTVPVAATNVEKGADGKLLFFFSLSIQLPDLLLGKYEVKVEMFGDDFAILKSASSKFEVIPRKQKILDNLPPKHSGSPLPFRASPPPPLEWMQQWTERYCAEFGYATSIERTLGDGGLGSIAKRQIKAGKLGFMPAAATMSRLSVGTTKAPEVFRSLYGNAKINHDLPMALMILFEKHVGEDSFWAPYFSILPTPERLAMIYSYWEPEFQQYLDISEGMMHDAKIFNQTIAEITSQFEKRGTREFMFFSPEQYTREDLIWAYAIIRSRVFGAANFKTILPVLDIPNHDVNSSLQRPGLAVTFDKVENHPQELQTLIMVSGKPIVDEKTGEEIGESDIAYEAGEEVMMLYGRFSNYHLAVGYGYVLQDNPFDAVHLTREKVLASGKRASTDEETRLLRDRLVSALDLRANKLEVALNGTFSNVTLPLLRGEHANAEDFEKIGVTGIFDGLPLPTAATEHAALSHLLSYLTSYEKRVDDFFASDYYQQSKKEGFPNKWKNDILNYVIEREKLILGRGVENVLKLWNKYVDENKVGKKVTTVAEFERAL